MNTDRITPSCRVHFYFTPLPTDPESCDLIGRHHIEKYHEPYLPIIVTRELQRNRSVCVGQIHLPQGTEKITGTISEVWYLKTVQEYTNPGLRTHCIEVKVAVSLPATNQYLFNEQTEMFLDFFEYCLTLY